MKERKTENNKDTLRASGDSFTIVPDALVRDENISGDAKATYLIIASHTTKERMTAWPGKERLMKLTGYKRFRLENAIKELVATHWLSVEKTPGKVNNYVVHQSTLVTNVHHAGDQPTTTLVTSPEEQQGKKNKEEKQIDACAPLLATLRDVAPRLTCTPKVKEILHHIKTNEELRNIEEGGEQENVFTDYVRAVAHEIKKKDYKNFTGGIIRALEEDYYLGQFVTGAIEAPEEDPVDFSQLFGRFGRRQPAPE